jgi:prepilin-type N-terminal cleavage/methylation domain-containing protein
MIDKKQNHTLSKHGFTLLEFLLVITIFGLVLAVVLPRALRATYEAKFGMVRQYGSEIASYMTQWGENQVLAQRELSPFTIKDFFMENIDRGTAGFESPALVDKYTGNDDFNGVQMLVPPEKIQKNPFNGVSYFSAANDDPEYVPSPKTGLLYFVSGVDPTVRNQYFRNFYLIFTGTGGKGRWLPWFTEWDEEGERELRRQRRVNRRANWQGQMNDQDPDAIRHGIFVARLPDSDVERRGGDVRR